MANYEYLFETRLNPSQRRALLAVQDAAKQQNLTAFLVGGAVRDLTAGSPVRDLDFVVQGAAAVLLPGLEAAGGVRAGEQTELERYFLLFPGGVRVELGSALNVTYPQPGKPVTEAASVLEDLRRRDFTINSMAVSLNEGSYGLLMDPLNGIADLENRELRLVSPYGFIEEPSRLIRATRLAARLGFALEERTQTRFENAKADGAIERLADWERRYELEEVFHEDDPSSIVEELTAQGWAVPLGLDWSSAAIDEDAMNRLRELHGQLDALGIHADIAATAFPLITAKLAPAKLAALKSGFARPGFPAQVDDLEGRAKEFAAQLTGGSAKPSETWKLLFASDPETVLRAAFNARSGALQAKFRQFLNEWPQARQRIPYAQMAEMRIQPNLPGYDQLLEDLFFAAMDGRLDTPEAIRAYLEPIAPPAPPTAAPPRRKAAKATKSKSKKAAAKAAESASTATAQEESAPIAESAPPAKVAAKTPPPVKPAPPEPARSVPEKKAAPAAVAETKPPAKAPAKAAQAPPAARKAPAKTPLPTKGASAKKPAPTPSKKSAPPPPARKVVATVAAPSRNVAAPAKAAAKGAVKVAAKNSPPPVKPAAKTAPKKVAPPTKASAKKTPPKKAPARTQAKAPPKKAAKAVKKTKGARR